MPGGFGPSSQQGESALKEEFIQRIAELEEKVKKFKELEEMSAKIRELEAKADKLKELEAKADKLKELEEKVNQQAASQNYTKQGETGDSAKPQFDGYWEEPAKTD